MSKEGRKEREEARNDLHSLVSHDEGCELKSGEGRKEEGWRRIKEWRGKKG